MMSIFSKLFGGGAPKEPDQPKREEPVDYQGLSIVAAPEKAEGQWRLAGYIVKKTETGDLERFFLRADTFPNRDEAIDFALRKGRQIIDQQGDRLFANGEPTGRA
ncbi:HlyU family transcriptional regulator [Aestuariispira insulae]|uniref:Transcriptional activator HlyU n=1 Tax=Aestuariispira insulae TaxID=1461337 RepID=A0A3D9HWK0_9PROT|nr:HlyU family transcriptional regulator [Aestuariispira insulae]RED53789.1 hypothetical protein DFP90_101588 [Aestuariispira insulae]